jgi:hypothetical protein
MDKPEIALALEGSKKPLKSPPLKALEDTPEDDDSMEGLGSMSGSIDADESEVAAAAALRTALKTGDDAEFAKALKGFIRLCEATEEGY